MANVLAPGVEEIALLGRDALRFGVAPISFLKRSPSPSSALFIDRTELSNKTLCDSANFCTLAKKQKPFIEIGTLLQRKFLISHL